jgi:mono/diheme cytochrome c family protein
MKTNYKILLSFSLFFSIVSCAVRKSEPITAKVVNVADSHTKNGQVLYNNYCQKCHPAGEAGLGPSVTSKPGFAKRFQMRHGLGVMPSFKKDQLSKRDVKDIAIYLRKLNQL